MANEILSSLLKEYEQKRLRAELDLEKRKEELYKNVPRLAQIEDKLSKYAINTAKEMLKNNKNTINELNIYVEKLKKEKKNILESIKLDSSYLKPKYECLDCNDTGYIVNEDFTTTMCHCLKQKILDKSYNKSNISNLDKENFKTFNLNIFSETIDEKNGMSPRDNMKYIYDKCKEFVDEFNNPNTKNLLFTGNIGLRKNFYV
ncbi:MAG: hypothetical protein IKF17_03795 [Clostridia bacterium]|nr:hypothetical protein [Clostridia bacterium]